MQKSERFYSEIDIDKAYIHGLECAVVVLEKAISLNYSGQQIMIKTLKKVLRKYKIRAIISQLQI